VYRNISSSFVALLEGCLYNIRNKICRPAVSPASLPHSDFFSYFYILI